MPGLPIDPVTYEVIRHKLVAITEEQRIALGSVSGSPVVTEASDFYNGLFLADGTIAAMGLQVAFQAGAMDLMIKALIGDVDGGLELAEGDALIANDPYRGALHQNDVQVIAPIFYHGELVAWSGSGAHQVDVGGMDFASWCPRAKDVYQEGLRIPGVKIVEQGRLRKDILGLILGASRLPAMLGLDIRAMIAACNVAQKRLVALIDRYGRETVLAVMRQAVDQSELKLRKRLSELPDGIFRCQDFLEHDGHEDRLYRIAVVMTKRGDSLELDFSDSSKQAPGYINCTRAGLIGGVVGALFPGLAFDIPWNGGLLRPVRVTAPEGLICNCRFPAPVSAATVEAIWCTQNCVCQAISKLLACSKAYGGESQAVSQGVVSTFNLGGRDQYGQPFGNHFLDPSAGGFGGYAVQDGFDVGGVNSSPVNNIANVESIENFAPVLYLHRRLIRDSGGAGMHRGGRTSGMALTVHHVPSLESLIMSHGVEVPNAIGVFGGLPGSCVVQKMLKRSDLRKRFENAELPTGVLEAQGELEIFGPRPGYVPMTGDDIFESSWHGGGGWGDPLERDPELARADVEANAVSLDCARRLYGVVIDDLTGLVNRDETEDLRTAMRSRRLEGVARPNGGSVEGTKLLQIGGFLAVWDTGTEIVIACRCGHVFGPASANWKQFAVQRRPAPEEFGRNIKLHGELELQAYLCPRCGLMLSAELSVKGEPPLWDIQLDEVGGQASAACS